MSPIMSMFSVAFSLFLLMDSLGNIPLYISLLKNFPPRKQRRIIFREMCIALLIIVLFQFVGEGLMAFLQVKDATIQVAGGLILFLIALKMIFPAPHSPYEAQSNQEEPFIVPLAVPLVAGPSVLAAVMIYARQQDSALLMLGAIFLAWVVSLLILLACSGLRNLLGWRGIIALERLMGLILTLIAVQMFLTGIEGFIEKIS